MSGPHFRVPRPQRQEAVFPRLPPLAQDRRTEPPPPLPQCQFRPPPIDPFLVRAIRCSHAAHPHVRPEIDEHRGRRARDDIRELLEPPASEAACLPQPHPSRHGSLREKLQGPQEVLLQPMYFRSQRGPGVVGDSLRTIFLKELYNGPSFYPLIIGSKNLRTLRLMKCSGDWDRMLQAITERVPGMVGIHLERIQVSDLGLNAISSCPSLEIFLMKTPYCTNLGLASVAEHCRLLRKLSIDGCRANSIGDQGLLSVATYCHNLQELVLVGVNATSLSLGSIASNCPNLERLALCGIKTVGDAEIACIAAKCTALKKLCIRSCPITDQGVEAVASGCPCLVKVKIKRCKSVTRRAVGWLRARRESLTLDLDTVGDQELGYLTGGGDW
ncbi:F-box protein At1g47056-like isoform X2 [Punica granatum]|uniref:F-box protein At1g47056-like isoform X2 n=1 Tax=Punica granatum TaxID=22663 RepID=A0A6P8C4P5_PUNGR|nr:F-box protein At1g47056-like isoform X2 [Punica granatum]